MKITKTVVIYIHRFTKKEFIDLEKYENFCKDYKVDLKLYNKLKRLKNVWINMELSHYLPVKKISWDNTRFGGLAIYVYRYNDYYTSFGRNVNISILTDLIKEGKISDNRLLEFYKYLPDSEQMIIKQHLSKKSKEELLDMLLSEPGR